MSRSDNIFEYLPNTDGTELSIAVVVSRFNQEICTALRHACISELLRLNVNTLAIEVINVPGALEIPLALQTLAKKRRFHALIALGVVIGGDTYHFDIVANDSCRALMEVQLDTGLPVANGILTCETEEQAMARAQQKGADCAQAAVEMAHLIRAINERRP